MMVEIQISRNSQTKRMTLEEEEILREGELGEEEERIPTIVTSVIGWAIGHLNVLKMRIHGKEVNT